MHFSLFPPPSFRARPSFVLRELFFCPDTDFPPPPPPSLLHAIQRAQYIFDAIISGAFVRKRETRSSAAHKADMEKREGGSKVFLLASPRPLFCYRRPLHCRRARQWLLAPNLIISRRKENRLWGKGGKDRRCI